MRNTNGVVTKYVYGRGLIGEETVNGFKTYHFDARGSTIAITDANGNITDTFAYDTYGKLLSRTGTSSIIFGYNGRDGVVTDTNGLTYMRARYYSPDMKRFINADIIAGAISNAITLNRFAYANGNPVSFVDPFGLSVWSWLKENVVDPVGNALTTAGNAIVDGAQAAGDFIVDTATTVGNAIVDGAQTAGEFIADTATNVGTAIVNDTKTAANWTNENIIKPTGEALSNAGRQIKDGFNSAVKNAKEFGAQVGEFAKNTFGAGVVQSQTYDTMSMNTLIAGYETGFSSSSVICGDISKPISVYAKNASEWWKIWEYKVGIQINIGDGGFYLEANQLENAIGVSNGNTSLELMSGLNKIGYTTSYEVDFSERTSGGVYQHAYIRTIPTAAAVVTVYYCWPALVGALGTGVAVVATP